VRESESYWRHGCKSTFFSIFIFFCVGGGLARSPYSRKKVKKGKGKAIPLQAWRGSEGSKRFRLPDFKTMGT